MKDGRKLAPLLARSVGDYFSISCGLTCKLDLERISQVLVKLGPRMAFNKKKTFLLDNFIFALCSDIACICINFVIKYCYYNIK